jgi:hypothetical protein
MKREHGKDLISLAILLVIAIFSVSVGAQTPVVRVPEPHYIAIDSKDNVYVAIKYGIIRITPDGTLTNLTKIAGTIGDLDKTWKNLVIDSRDILYANDGKLIYKFTFDRSGKFVGSVYAGQQWTYKLEDGPVATAGINNIGVMTIDRNDNIYFTDSYDKIKDTIGTNFVTDSFYLNDPAKKYQKYKARRYSLIRKISGGRITTLKTPDGKYMLPNDISGMAFDTEGNIIYSVTGFGRFIGKIDVTSGVFTSIAGQPYKREWCPVYTQGENSKAEFVDPAMIIVSKSGDIIFTDGRLHRIIKISGGKVSTLAGSSIIDPCSQNIGGRAQEGNRDGKALTSLFNFPEGLAYDSKGNLFIADMHNHAIRKLSPDGMVSAFAK